VIDRRRVGKGAWHGLESRLRACAPCPPRRPWWARRAKLVATCGAVLRALAHPTVAAIVAAAVACTSFASSAQSPAPQIWDVKPGTPVGELPDEAFVDPACGTNGGPPGLQLGAFENFAKCRAEASGLREVWFRYDDELEYIARAARDADAIARSNAMVVLGQPVILSLLVDANGLVQGYRIATDPHAEEELRMNAYTIAVAFKARFGVDGWTCEDLAPGAGETPIAGVFVKERCRKTAEGQNVVVESRYYYKPGQALVDPNSGLATVNQFESSARMEAVAVGAAAR
jgi:hypothetical protein